MSILTLLLSYNICDMSVVETYLNTVSGFSGAVAVMHGKDVIFKHCYGYANYEFDIANNETALFCIASITKSFTAIAIMKLQEMGKLNVHDPISKYIPDFTQGDTITLHHLLTHMSGVRNYYRYCGHADDIFTCDTLDQMVDIIKRWELDFGRGSTYCYSNTGYLLLAYIVEKVSEASFEAFLSEHIFKPAGMCNSGSIASGSVIKYKAQGYVRQGGTLCNARIPVIPLTLLGNGDLYASIDDMMRWIDALCAGKIVSHDSLQIIMGKHIAMEGSTDRFYGYGWFVDKQDGKSYIECSGALVGFLSKVIRFVDEDITIVILTNVEDREQFCEVVETLSELVLKNNNAY